MNASSSLFDHDIRSRSFHPILKEVTEATPSSSSSKVNINEKKACSVEDEEGVEGFMLNSDEESFWVDLEWM